MMPPPVILLIVLMVGYPLVQILVIRLRRAKRLRFNGMADGLLADGRLGHYDRNVVRRLKDSSRGGPRTLKTLLLVPIAAFSSAFEVDEVDNEPKADNDLAAKLEWLRDQSIGLEMAAYPIGTAVAVPVAFVAWALGACVMLLKGAAKPAFPGFLNVIRSTTSTGAISLASRPS